MKPGWESLMAKSHYNSITYSSASPESECGEGSYIQAMWEVVEPKMTECSFIFPLFSISNTLYLL